MADKIQLVQGGEKAEYKISDSSDEQSHRFIWQDNTNSTTAYQLGPERYDTGPNLV